MISNIAPWPLWKALVLVILPLAVGYQLIWQWQFDRLFAAGGQAMDFARLAFIKLSGELLMYSAMWYGMWRYCRPGHRILWWSVCLAWSALLVVTFRAWLSQL